MDSDPLQANGHGPSVIPVTWELDDDLRRFDMRRGEGGVMVLVWVWRSHPRQAEMEEKE